MNNFMKKSFVFFLATCIYVGASCQDDKTIYKLLKATEGVETPFIKLPDGILDKLPIMKYPGTGIAVSTGTGWGTSLVDNSGNWNTAFSWGNHAGLYEPVLGNPTVSGYVLSSTTAGIRTWVPMTGGGTMVYPAAGIPLSTGSAWGGSIVNNSVNWNTAYNWGNHAGLYRPVTWVPAFTDITGKPTTLAGYGITDAMNTSHPANTITPTQINSWNTAYSWGNHSGLYRPVTWVPAWTDITGKPAFSVVSITGKYTDLLNIPTTFAPSSHQHDYNTDIVNKPAEQDLMDALKTLDYYPLKGKTTAEINALVIPPGYGAIAFDATLNVYKFYKNGVWTTAILGN